MFDARRLPRPEAPGAAFAAVLLVLACGGGEPAETDAPSVAAGDTLATDTTRVALGPVCEPFSENAARLDLKARWEGDQVRVTGSVGAGAGNALSLGLSQQGRFIYDRVFKSELMGVIQLEGDAVDLTTVTNEPSRSERGAFSRTGATALDPSLPACIDVLLYERGSLDRLAELHMVVEGAAFVEPSQEG